MNRYHSSSRTLAWVGLWTIVVSGLPNITWGQDALQGTLQGDRAYRERNKPPTNLGDYHHIGAFSYFTSVSYGVEWRDNIFNSESSRHSDFIHRPGFDITGSLKISDRSFLHLGFGAGYSQYMNTSGQNRFHIAPNSELAWDITAHDVLLTLYDRMTYSEDVLSQSVITGVAAFPRFDNTLGMRATWSPGRFVIQGGYGHQTFLSSSATFTDSNRSAENFFERIGYKIAPETVVGIESTDAFTDYTEKTQHDNTSISLGPYAEWRVTRSLTLSVRAGALHYTFQDIAGQPNLPSLSSYYGSFDIEHEVTSKIKQHLLLDRKVQQGLSQGGQYIQSSSVEYRIGWNFKPRASLSGNLFMEDGAETRAGISEPFSRFGTGIGISYELLKKITPSLSYSYTQRSSKLAGRSYEVNGVTVYVSYRF